MAKQCKQSTSRDQGHGASYTGSITSHAYWVTLAAASGGLLFGWHIGVMPAIESDAGFQQLFFPQDALLSPYASAYCRREHPTRQLLSAFPWLVGAAAALLVGWAGERLGRRPPILAAGACFALGSALQAGAWALTPLVVGRALAGLGVGCAVCSCPLYICEVAPYRARGALAISFQLAVTVGLFSAQLANIYTLNLLPLWGWRLSLALGVLGGAIVTAAGVLLPDTPAGMLCRRQVVEAKEQLQWLRGVEDVTMELEALQEAVFVSNACRHGSTLFHRRYWPQLAVSLGIPAFQQLTGINAIMFFAPAMFAALGSQREAVLLDVVVIGTINVAATLVAMCLVDVWSGRRGLFLIGGVQMIAAEAAVGALVYKAAGNTGEPGLSGTIAVGLLVATSVYVAAFAWSWGPLGWLVPIEVAPLEVRFMASGVNACVNFMSTFLISLLFLRMLCTMRYGVFIFFAAMTALMTLVVLCFVPETSRVPIEEVEEVRVARHRFWRHVVAGTRPPMVPSAVLGDGTVRLSMPAALGLGEVHLLIPHCCSYKDGTPSGSVARLGRRCAGERMPRAGPLPAPERTPSVLVWCDDDCFEAADADASSDEEGLVLASVDEESESWGSAIEDDGRRV